jgi:hypothetical protein
MRGRSHPRNDRSAIGAKLSTSPVLGSRTSCGSAAQSIRTGFLRDQPFKEEFPLWSSRLFGQLCERFRSNYPPRQFMGASNCQWLVKPVALPATVLRYAAPDRRTASVDSEERVDYPDTDPKG